MAHTLSTQVHLSHMTNRFLAVLALIVLTWGSLCAAASIEDDWQNPPTDARLRAYWWWLNGNVTEEAITRDLEEMKAKGFGGALICDADGSAQDNNAPAPHGPTFLSPEWLKLYRHALREAERLGLEMSLNIQSGWNLGGPMVTREDAPKQLSWTESQITGGKRVQVQLEKPLGTNGFSPTLFVLAYPAPKNLPANRKPLTNLPQKTLRKALTPSSAPSSQPLFDEIPGTPGEEDMHAKDVLDITKHMSADGLLDWDCPPGDWKVLRIGYALNDHCRVSTCSDGWDGYAIDPFDAAAFKRYWNAVVEPLIAEAGPAAGKTLKYLHTDSWEVEVANWTPTLREEFTRRRGYDPLPWLPVIAGKIVNSREESNRFLNDYRRTMGDLAIDNHYKLFKAGAHQHGMLIHPESGGPHAVPIDAQQCLGYDDAPMSEFWAMSWRHRVGEADRFFVKQPASAAHVYGHKLALAEGFTTIGPHWQETLWDNLKPTFDHAATEGVNLLVWHAFVCSPKSEGMPGQQYFAGTHLNPNVTWWNKSEPFFAYINRCQSLLQRGQPVSDIAYYYGDHVPNFTQLRSSDPAKVGAGYDYDVLTEEALVNLARVENGRIVLSNGVSYHALVLPPRDMISMKVLAKLAEFGKAGATILGPQPSRASSLNNYPANDAVVARMGAELWSGKAGQGRFIADKTAREVLLADGMAPDFEAAVGARLDYIHRRDGEAEIYFVANRTNDAQTARCGFRVAGKAPELWNPMTGERRFASAYEERDGHTFVPLDFEPYGSWFVVFREPAGRHPATRGSNAVACNSVLEISGAWDVDFDQHWGGPGPVKFDQLVNWTTREEPGIKYYSGTAVYRKTFEQPAAAIKSGEKIYIDLGNVREIAEVKLNGKPCGITWAPPFRVEVTDAIQAGKNNLEVEVVNFWPNRIIGDASLPASKRLTRTNIRKLTSETKLMDSGLLGPVTVKTSKAGLRPQL